MTQAGPPPFPYRPPPELTGGPPSRAPVAIVGAGPVGLALALDLATRGVASVVLDDNDRVSTGSRAICWAKRSLEILDRLGLGERVAAMGVTWKLGRVFDGDREVFAFDLLPEAGHKMPAFVNLPQCTLERLLVERAAAFPDLVDLRWRNRVTGHADLGDRVRLEVATPDGPYAIEAGWMVACDGARSPTRARLGLAFEGQAFEDRFLIADVRMAADFPAERRFWFNPPFHDGETALLHKQPDDVWRIDLQLGPDADPEAEKRPEAVAPRIAKAVGGRSFALDWVSVYAFRCARLARFVHGRVIFAGDSAHVVSPFGARGGNGGLHDVDNLGWKLAAIMGGKAGPGLLASYDAERGHGADENIRQSTRATEFMSPPDAAARRYRDAVLALAPHAPFARRLVNSGRLSTPASYAGLALQTPDPTGAAPVPPGAACPDAPWPGGSWLLDRLGRGFTLLGVGATPPAVPGAARLEAPAEGLVGARYGGGVYLIRPDQHVAAWSARPDAGAAAAALDRAMGLAPAEAPA